MGDLIGCQQSCQFQCGLPLQALTNDASFQAQAEQEIQFVRCVECLLSNHGIVLPQKNKFLFYVNLEYFYCGELKRKVPHGKGFAFYRNKFFHGGFKLGVPYKQGISLDHELIVYVGQIKQGRRQGKGTMTSLKDYRTYIGNWKQDMKEGEGIQRSQNLDIFQGLYEKDQPIKGVLYRFNKRLMLDHADLGVKDQIEYMKRHPFSQLYIGQFRQGVYDGKGCYKWSDSRIYNGSWLAGKMNGFGHFKWPDGSSYQGDYVQDQKHGFGKMVWARGKQYIGQFIKGKPQGFGVMRLQNTEKMGVWQHGKLVKQKKQRHNLSSEEKVIFKKIEMLLEQQNKKTQARQMSKIVIRHSQSLNGEERYSVSNQEVNMITTDLNQPQEF